MTVVQWRTTATVAANTYSPVASVAGLSDGGYVVVWEGATHVMGQRYDAFGSTAGAQFIVDTGTAAAKDPKVAALPDGGFAVGYTKVFSGTDSDPYFARYDASGRQTLLATFDNSSATLANQVSIAQGDNGGLVAAYHDPANSGDIIYATVSSTGTIARTSFTSSTTGDQNQPDVAYNSTVFPRVAGVTWYDAPSVTVRANFISSSGLASANDIVIGTASSGIQGTPRIVALADNTFVVVWVTNDANQDPAAGIRGQIVSTTGAFIGSAFSINSHRAGDQANPEITALSGGGFSAIWSDGISVRGQIFDGLGRNVGSEFILSAESPFTAASLSVAELADHRIVITRTHTDPDTNVPSVVADIVDPRDGIVNGSTGLDNDLLLGGNGNDQVRGFLDNDTLYGFKGNDSLYGGDGHDRLIGGLGDDTLDGGGGNNILTGGSERVTTWGLLGAVDRLADFNGDGKTDVLETFPGGIANVSLSDGVRFHDPVIWSDPQVSLDGVPQKFGDFNGDGKTDFLAVKGGSIYVGRSTGFGFQLGFWGFGATPNDKVGDFNGDGKSDLVQFAGDQHAYVWTSTGTAFNNYANWGSGFSPNDRVADFNGDHKDDIIQIGGDNKAYVWLSNGTSFGNYTPWGFGFTPNDKFGDFNGDGKTDIVQFGADQKAYVWISNGTSFNMYQAWGSGFSPNDKIGDFNGDGKDDIVQLNDGDHNAYVWLSNGTSFGNYSVWASGVSSKDQIGDFNGDGKDDIVQLNVDGNAYAWLGSTASFRPYTVFGTGTPIGDSAGNDTFVFTGNFGKSVVTDFQPGPGIGDTLQLDSSQWSSIQDVLNHTADDGAGNTVITHDALNTITLYHVQKAQLVNDDFQLV